MDYLAAKKLRSLKGLKISAPLDHISDKISTGKTLLIAQSYALREARGIPE